MILFWIPLIVGLLMGYMIGYDTAKEKYED